MGVELTDIFLSLKPRAGWTKATTQADPTLLIEKELRRIVRDAIEKLPESYRVVLLLRDIEELTPEETAHSLGITRTAVKVRLHRGRQALRTLLDPHLRERP